MKLRTVIGVKTKLPIEYSFKELTYREFNSIIDNIDAVRESTDRKLKMNVNEAVFAGLVNNSDQLLNEASNKDVDNIFADAIKFNQAEEPEVEKKSE